MKFAGKMISVHCEVVSRKDIAVVARINTVAINASNCGFAMLDNLLVACCVCADEVEVFLCLTVARFAHMWGISVSERRCLSMEDCFQRRD